MIWFLLSGVMELAVARQRPYLSGQASQCRVANVALMCLQWLVGVLARSPGAADVMAIVSVGCVVLLLFLILQLIYRARHELSIATSAVKHYP
jgi:hypothetical protein